MNDILLKECHNDDISQLIYQIFRLDRFSQAIFIIGNISFE